jgi:hypothetical protein
MADLVTELRTGRGVNEGPMRDAWVHAKMQEAAARIEQLEAALREIADTAHEGGLQNMDESMAMIRIRKSTLPYWKNRAPLEEKP